MDKKSAFLDYYGARNIIPVLQDIPDMAAHFNRRAALFRQLGLPFSAISGRRFLEFGPGTGQNALFTLANSPSELVLVDANPASLEATRKLLSRNKLEDTKIDIVNARIEEFREDGAYDFVLCEGVIPHQQDPVQMLKQVTAPVKPGGVVIITCMDVISMMSEALRRVFKPLIMASHHDEDDGLARLVSFFQPDLEQLPGMTRCHEDWVLDVILHPNDGGIPFSIADAIDAIRDEFDVHGCSPHFLNDWRWYKQISTADPGLNDILLDCYERKCPAFLDYRVDPDDIAGIPVDELTAHCRSIYDAEKLSWRGDRDAVHDIVGLVGQIQTLVAKTMPMTAQSLADWRRMIDELQAGRLPAFGAFAGFFGRGQQYLSFIRRVRWD